MTTDTAAELARLWESLARALSHPCAACGGSGTVPVAPDFLALDTGAAKAGMEVLLDGHCVIVRYVGDRKGPFYSPPYDYDPTDALSVMLAAARAVADCVGVALKGGAG